MPRTILVATPSGNIPVTVYDYQVVVPTEYGIRFLDADGPLPQDAAREMVASGAVTEPVFFLSARKERGVMPDFWRVTVTDGKVASVSKTEKTFRDYDLMIADALREERKEIAKAQKKAARKAK